MLRLSRILLAEISTGPADYPMRKMLPVMRKAIVLCLSVYWLLSVSTQAGVIFPYGASWKYFIGTEEASSPISAWRQSNFVDSAWQDGIAPLGYATPANDPLGYEATIRTTLPTAAASNYVCV